MSAPPGNKRPDSPTDLPKRSWFAVLKRTVRSFSEDNLIDWGAALTYYGVLSLFPGLLVITSVLGLLGPEATQALTDNIKALVPGAGQDIMLTALDELQQNRGLAWPLAVLGVAGALWSSSAYVAAFMRVSNAIYGTEERRATWKMLLLRVALTAAIVVLLALCVIGVVATGAIAERVGQVLGVGSTAVLVWDIVKWPVIVLVVSFVFALLYGAAPSVEHPRPGLRWLSPGGLLAVALWLLASAAFAFYLANFDSYNKTYGSLGGVISFLVWMWISNLAVLLGAEFNAELARGRRIEAGEPAEERTV